MRGGGIKSRENLLVHVDGWLMDWIKEVMPGKQDRVTMNTRNTVRPSVHIYQPQGNQLPRQIRCQHFTITLRALLHDVLSYLSSTMFNIWLKLL